MEMNTFSVMVAELKDSFHLLFFRLTNETFYDNHPNESSQPNTQYGKFHQNGKNEGTEGADRQGSNGSVNPFVTLAANFLVEFDFLSQIWQRM